MLTSSSTPPSFRAPVSQACTQAQFETPEFLFWCREIREPHCYHRKLWEYCYLLQALAYHGMIAPGRRGVGFGVGKELTSAVLASRGVHVTATDLDPIRAHSDWVQIGQHAFSINDLNERWICPQADFERLVEFRPEDMNHISPDLTDYDFAWSLCAFEHLGNIENGLNFVRNSLNCIRPGGLLVHTSELNCASEVETIETESLVVFRRSDYETLAREFTAQGHQVELNFHLGDGPMDSFIDEEPYTTRRHLRLRLGGHVTTSFGLIVRKAAER
jgi:hypothetical protein